MGGGATNLLQWNDLLHYLYQTTYPICLHVTINKLLWHFPLLCRQFPSLNFLVKSDIIHAYIIVLPNLTMWKFPWMFSWRLILIIQALLSPILA